MQKLCVPVNLLIAFSILRVSCAGTDKYRNLIEDDVCIEHEENILAIDEA